MEWWNGNRLSQVEVIISPVLSLSLVFPVPVSLSLSLRLSRWRTPARGYGTTSTDADVSMIYTANTHTHTLCVGVLTPGVCDSDLLFAFACVHLSVFLY